MRDILHEIFDYMYDCDVEIQVVMKGEFYWIAIVDRRTDEVKYLKERCLVPSVVINPKEINHEFYKLLYDLDVFIELVHDDDIKLTFGDLWYKKSYKMSMKKVSDTEWVFDDDVFKEYLAKDFHKDPIDCIDLEIIEITDDDMVGCDKWDIDGEHYIEPCGVIFYGECRICGRKLEGYADNYDDGIEWGI